MNAASLALIGRLAVHYRMISAEQLAVALQEQRRAPERLIGELLVELGFVDSRQLAQLVEAQRQYLAQNPEQAAAMQAEQAQAQRNAAAANALQYAQAAQAQYAPQHPPPPPPVAVQAQAPAPPPPPPETRGRGARQVSHKLHVPHRPAPNTATQQWLHRTLQQAAARGASDVHIHAGAQVKARIHGSLQDLTRELIDGNTTSAVLLPALTDWQWEQYAEHGEVDYACEVPGAGRFRVNVYNQHAGPCGVFHYLPAQPPHLADLGLPSSITRAVHHNNGIVLITGPGGSGKTSTMAALVNLLNEERSDHILSIEDPIEFVHTSKRCMVNQRQISRHTHSFAAALTSALREDPDIICIGELRDLETISLALSAAETGHLVLGTMNTQGAVRTVNRIIGAYPATQQAQIRTMLSESLRAVISQKLLPTRDGLGMALAYELLFVNQAAGNLIRENRTFQLGSVLQTGRQQGMISMDDSLRDLLQRRVINLTTARLNADNPKSFADPASAKAATEEAD